MRDLILIDELKDFLDDNVANKYNASVQHRERPGVPPPIAVKHGHRIQIRQTVGHVPSAHAAHRHQIGSSVMIHDALGIAGGTRSIIQRNGLPLIARSNPLKSLLTSL